MGMTPKDIYTALQQVRNTFPKPGEMSIGYVERASDTGAFEGTSQRAFVISMKSAWQLEDKPPTQTFAVNDETVIDYVREVAASVGQTHRRLLVVIDLGADATSVWVTSKTGCFVATAAYGSAMAVEVRVLSEFRDRVLLSSRLGRRFVGLYYRVSPRLASFIRGRNTTRAVIRQLLRALVRGARLSLRRDCS